MKTDSTNRQFLSIRVLAICASLLLFVPVARAVDGSWLPADGLWSAPGSWQGGNVADGVGSLAYFTNDITANVTVHLDTARTNGNLVFGDGDTNTAANWIVDNNATAANILTLSGGATPGVTVNALGAGAFANVSAVIAGRDLYETGPGLFVPSGLNTFTNMTINGGRVVWNTPNGNGSLGANNTNNIITLTNGATLIRSNTANNLLFCVNVKGTNTIDATGAATGNLNGMFLGDGTLNMILPPGGSSLTTGGNVAWNSNIWAFFTGTVILSGGGNLRFDGNNATTFHLGGKQATFDLGQTNNVMNERGAGAIQAHTTFIGALKGGPSTAISVNSKAGDTNTLQVGDKNLSTTFEGAINNPNGTTFTALTKSGNATLTLVGTNNYSGATRIENGKLTLAATALINNTPLITTVSPGVFDVSAFGTWTNAANQGLSGNGGVAGSAYINSGLLSPGVGTNIGRLTISNDLTLDASVTTTFRTAFGSTNASIGVGGNLTLLGNTTVQIQPPNGAALIPNGTYVLVQWGGSLVGDTANLTLSYPAQAIGATLTLSTNLPAKQIRLTIAGNDAGQITWQGDGAGNVWDNSTPNWKTGGGSSVAFTALDNALFNDVGSSTPPVNISDTVTPSSVIVSNITKDYTFSGGGKITGVTSVTKVGSGKLTVTANNDYSGGTTINAGTVQVGDGGTSGSLGSGSVANSSTLIYSRSDNVTLGSPLLGSGTLVQDGSNGLASSLILTGDSVNSGGVFVKSGTLQLGDGTSLHGTLTSTVTNTTGSTLRYYYNGANTLKNGVAGNGTNLFEASIGSVVYTYPLSVTNIGFTGTINLGSGICLHADNGNIGFMFGNASTVNVPFGTQVWVDNTTNAYNNTFNIAGNGWSGDTLPADSPGLGAIRIFNCTVSGQINLLSDSRIGGTSSGATITGPIRGDGFELTTLATGASPDQFFLTLAPTNGPAVLRSIFIKRSGLQAGANNAFTNAITMTGESRLRLNGFNITLANLTGGSPATGSDTTNCLVWNNNSTNAATLSVGTDGNATSFDGIFGDGTNQPLNLTKVGGGTWTLTANSTNTGAVTVSGGTLLLSGNASFSNANTFAISNSAILDVNSRGDQTLTLNSGQTLKGNGTLNGSVTGNANSTVSPGASVGTLTIQNNATLNGTLRIELNRANGAQSNDVLSVGGTLTTSGATLVVTNIGPALAAGNFFQLFPSGRTFASVVLPTSDLNGMTYTWNNTVASNGRITVQTAVGGGVNTSRTNITAVVNGSNLQVSWPADHTGWTLQIQTNALSAGLNNAGWIDVPNSAASNTATIPITPTNGTVLLRLRYFIP